MPSVNVAGHKVSTKENSVSRTGISYLSDLIAKHTIYNGNKVLLKDNELIAKYELTEGKYYGMIRKLIAIGVISEVVSVGNSYKKMASLYSIDTELLSTRYGINLCPKPAFNSVKTKTKKTEKESNAHTQHTEKKPLSEKEIQRRLSKVRIGGGLRIYGLSDAEITEQLYKKYPQLAVFQKMINEINANENDRYNNISMLPSIHRSATGAVTSIGLRAVTHFAQTSNKTGKLSRTKVLEQELGETFYEMDVHGSVPRVAHLMLTGQWDEADVDPYEIMFKPLCSHWDRQARDMAKSLFMKAMFGGSAGMASWRDTWKIYKYLQNDITDHIYRVDGLTCSDLEQIDATLKQSKYRMITKHDMEIIKGAVARYTGCTNQVNTEVFLHESCIYVAVRYELMKRGIKCCQCYDAFYTNDSISEAELADIVRNCALQYYKDWHTVTDMDETTKQKSEILASVVPQNNEMALDHIIARLPSHSLVAFNMYITFLYRWLAKRDGQTHNCVNTV